MDLKGPFHFIGVGGISMSGIARLLIEQGISVSGSDLRDSSLLRQLRRMGARITIGHRPENLGDAKVVVLSSAIPEDNVELQEAKRRRVPLWPRAQMIARLMEGKKGIAVAGTHGKTTTTSMVSLLLERSGFDPTVLIGGEVNDLGGNAKLGKGEFVITEADESDGSFLYLKPHTAIITNIELDHPDFFNSRTILLDVFSKFMNCVQSDGFLILCADDPTVAEVYSLAGGHKGVITYGLENGDIRAKDIQSLLFGSRFNVSCRNQNLGEFRLQIPGKHNIANALAVIAVGLTLNLEPKVIRDTLLEYRGVHRRFEKVGEKKSIVVVDDYAHHPTEIRATLAAARECRYKRVVVAFQPHRYSRTQHLMADFAVSFADADLVVLTSIYSAGEKPIPDVSGARLAELVCREKKGDVIYIPQREKIAPSLWKLVREGDLVITMGAGDIYKTAREFLTCGDLPPQVVGGDI